MMKTINYRKENEPWNAYIRQVYKKTHFLTEDLSDYHIVVSFMKETSFYILI